MEMKELTEGNRGMGLQAQEQPGCRRGCAGTLEEQSPGEGWCAWDRGNRSQAGLVFEGWSDNCGFYWERTRITGGFPDFLEPPGPHLSTADNQGTPGKAQHRGRGQVIMMGLAEGHRAHTCLVPSPSSGTSPPASSRVWTRFSK